MSKQDANAKIKIHNFIVHFNLKKNQQPVNDFLTYVI